MAKSEREQLERDVAAALGELVEASARHGAQSEALHSLTQRRPSAIDNPTVNANGLRTARGVADEAVAHRVRARKIEEASRQLREVAACVRFAELRLELRREDLRKADADVGLLEKHRANEIALLKRQLLKKEERIAEEQSNMTRPSDRRS